MSDLEKATSDLLQSVGDDIADVFDQMIKGKWTDDHGHDVKTNAAMIALKERLLEMVKFRAEWMGMEDTTEPTEVQQGLVPIPDTYSEQ